MSNVKLKIFVFVCFILLLSLNGIPLLKAETQSENSRTYYTIQIGSSKDLKAIDNELSRLKSQGLDAFTRYESVENKGMWYRIYVGLFENQDIAMDFAEKLMKKKIISYSWVKEIKNPPGDITPIRSTEPTQEPDSDGDGIADTKDECPDTPKGITVNSAGCPSDLDGDGVYDYQDKCPGTPKELKVDENGCPIQMEKTTMITLNIQFNTNQAEIKPEYYDRLKEVADFMTSNPAAKVVIEGHTDSVGSAAYNQKLSQKRADSVRDYLIENFNISPDRLTAKGYGEERPVTTNETKEGRRMNRRIQAVITVPSAPPQPAPSIPPSAPPPEKKPPEKKPPEKRVEPEQAPEPEKPISAKKAEESRFSIGLKAGPYFASSVGGFEISRTSGSSTEIWKFNDSHISIGLGFSYQLTRRFSIDGSYEKAFSSDLDLSQFALGSSYHFNPAGVISPYVKASLLYGSLSWSDAPGDFDNGFGWQLGLGATKRIFSKFKVGLEAYYQGIGYDYNAPAGSGVTATDSKVDFSGFAVMGTVSYCF